nr:PREDICTED: kidney mitochondrial carrier protein 1-like isoform X2 [Saccoglossus kowalevskii]
MIHAFSKITQEEGVRALYSGVKVALLRQASYGTIKFGCYHTFKRLLVPDPANETVLGNVLCGVSAGVLASSVANPTDVVKIRMQTANTSYRGNANSGIVVSFMTIYHEEGTRGLWRGVSPTAQRAAIIAGVQLPTYDWMKKEILEHQIMGDTVATHFVSSVVAGLAACIASNPVDVAKTRMMNQRHLKAHIVEGSRQNVLLYKNTVDCLFKTASTEGFRALYKGFIPSWLRMGPWNIIFFVTYEQLKRLNHVVSGSGEKWC